LTKAEYVEIKKEVTWEHLKREKNGQMAQCKMCQSVLKTTSGSTKGLHEHEPVNGACRIKVIGG